MIGEATEAFVIGQLGAHLFQVLRADKLGGLSSAIDVIELIVGAVAAWVLGVFASAAWLAAHVVLTGKAAGPHRP